MKRKFVILPLILACDLLVGCSVSSNESSNTSSGPEIATVVDIDDRIDYLSNDIPGEEELNLWWHANTISDDEWDEHYKEREDEDDYCVHNVSFNRFAMDMHRFYSLPIQSTVV